jgi:hypothetical protein
VFLHILESDNWIGDVVFQLFLGTDSYLWPVMGPPWLSAAGWLQFLGYLSTERGITLLVPYFVHLFSDEELLQIYQQQGWGQHERKHQEE